MSGAECRQRREDGRVDGTQSGDVPTTELGQRSELRQRRDAGCASVVTKLNGVVVVIK